MTDLDCSLELEGVSKRFGEVIAVDRVTLRLRRGELFSLLGPSGCGKTTLLRLVAGLEPPDAGTLRLDGREVTALPAHRRPVHTVFQQYALFPHLTVAENVAFGLRYQRLPRRAHAGRVAEAVALVRLAGCEGRYPAQLSGGQRQRVALARALALQPQVLLLDEPLGALDQELRKQMQVELRALQRRLGITFLFVTHDQEEALTLSDRIAVMSAGRIEQLDTPAAIFERPRTPFVARFMGAENLFTASAADDAGGDRGQLTLSLAGGSRFDAPLPAGFRPRGGRLRFTVRPERLRLGPDSPGDGGPAVAVTVEDRVYQGVATAWVVRGVDGERFVVHAPSAGHGDAGSEPQIGDRLHLSFRPRHAVLLSEPEGEDG